MSRRLDGVGAAPGRALGPASWVTWEVPEVAHRTILPEDVEAEVARFHAALAWAQARIREMHDRTAAEVGEIEAKIFDPQLLMLEDPELVDGTLAYIQDNFLSAERAFDWRLLEIRSRLLDVAHAMVVDRLADLQDVRLFVLSHLLGVHTDSVELPDEPAILLFQELTPSVAVRLDRKRVLGLLTGGGTRAAHSAIIARSMGIPIIVSIGSALEAVQDGDTVMMDGGTGQIVVNPSRREIKTYRRMVAHLTRRREQYEELPAGATHTADGAKISLQANLDQPFDVPAATRVGAEGVGLFRSEFLVIGRRVIPTEEEQFQAYRTVVEAFPDHDVTLRTFDIGGDKFPLFLDMPVEQNPYLGWRAIRVCLDLPDLFRNQLRAAVRAAEFGRMQILIPFVVSLDEILQTREILEEVIEDLYPGGEAPDVPLGVMIETPAVVELLDVLAPHIQFASLGTNDLTQYVLAADRGNMHVSGLSDPLHPALYRQYARVRRVAAAHGLPVSVCGDPRSVCRRLRFPRSGRSSGRSHSRSWGRSAKSLPRPRRLPRCGRRWLATFREWCRPRPLPGYS